MGWLALHAGLLSLAFCHLLPLEGPLCPAYDFLCSHDFWFTCVGKNSTPVCSKNEFRIVCLETGLGTRRELRTMAGIRLTVSILILKSRNQAERKGEGTGAVLRSMHVTPEKQPLQFLASVAEEARHPWSCAISHRAPFP